MFRHQKLHYSIQWRELEFVISHISHERKILKRFIREFRYPLMGATESGCFSRPRHDHFFGDSWIHFTWYGKWKWFSLGLEPPTQVLWVNWAHWIWEASDLLMSGYKINMYQIMIFVCLWNSITHTRNSQMSRKFTFLSRKPPSCLGKV